MKRRVFAAILLAICFLLPLVGCGGEECPPEKPPEMRSPDRLVIRFYDQNGTSRIIPPYSTVVIPYTGESWDYFTAIAEVYSEKYQMYLSIGTLDFIRYYQYIDHPDSPYYPFQGKTYTRDYPVEPGTYECMIGGGSASNLYYGLFVYVTLIIE